jgi:hypothetical protein
MKNEGKRSILTSEWSFERGPMVFVEEMGYREQHLDFFIVFIVISFVSLSFERSLMYRSYRRSVHVVVLIPHAQRLAGAVTRGWSSAIAPNGAKKISPLSSVPACVPVPDPSFSFFYPDHPAYPVIFSSSSNPEKRLTVKLGAR